MQAEILHVGANPVLVCTLQMSTVLRVLETPRGVLGKGTSRNYSSPHADPAAVTVLRRTLPCFLVRMLPNSLEINPSCKQNLMVSVQGGSEG